VPLRQTYCTQLNDPLTRAVTSDTFTTITDLLKGTHSAPGAQPCIIPTGYLKNGMVIRVEAWGTFTNASTTPTIVFTLGWGATPTVLGANVALTETSVASVPLLWRLKTTTTVYDSRTASAVVTSTQGRLEFNTAVNTAGTPLSIPGVSYVDVNVDNSAAAQLSVWATLGTSSASNTVILRGLIIEELTQI
jgi:hypothetical protein